MTALDPLVATLGTDPYWVGSFEDGITEVGIRAALWGVAENDGGNRADLMLEEWAGRGYPRMRHSDALLSALLSNSDSKRSDGH